MDTHDSANYSLRKLRIDLVFGGAVVGLASGLISVLYRYTLGRLDDLRNILYGSVTLPRALLMLAGFFVLAYLMHLLLTWAPLSGGSGIPQIRGELLGKADIEPVPTLVSKFLGGAMGAFSGLTLGREGPSIQLGGTLAKMISKLFRASEMERRYLITAGASAGLAAAFNAPLAGALFALEELHKSFSHFFVVPCVVASVVANFISFSFLGMEPAFSFPMTEMLPVRMIWAPIIIGIFGGIFGSLFNKGLLFGGRQIKKLPLPRYVVIFLAMAIAFAVGIHSPLLLGGGHGLIEQLAKMPFAPKTLLLFFAIRLVLVWTGYDSGAQGGIFLPVLTLGALLGAFCHGFLIQGDMYYANFLYLGMAAILSSVVQAPLLSILLVSEMSGTMLQMISITAAAMVAYLVAQLFNNGPIYESLYDNMFSNEDEIVDHGYTMQYFFVPGDADYVGIPLEKLKIPHHPLIASIKREDITFTPNKDTILLEGDELLVLCKEQHLESLSTFFGDVE
ncbi:MAG: ClC family H(+)/Cl(-) exchange transporter [Peptoniphilus sp.]|nr:ClC family H(+)/Cl(-) exchange transporter [Peptoniphilus sp.]MDD7362880.1 ClC family H(+)/Cl(-) exchange transporter [Bacillota bacterium]MDY6044879.1 ClC family H(+)/Cl(-) exchange transporter [Peptoniphilus sp.]